jgi:Spy/CpxP family protein refolding chaperone
MLKWIAASALAVLLVIPAGLAAQGRPPGDYPRSPAGQDRPHKWWTDEQTRAELGLTAEQASRAEEIFQTSVPRLRQLWKDLDAGEQELSGLIRENKADESVIAAKVDTVERVRAELNKGRTLMLYRIHRLLTPEQREKLNAIHERERERRKSGERPR